MRIWKLSSHQSVLEYVPSGDNGRFFLICQSIDKNENLLCRGMLIQECDNAFVLIRCSVVIVSLLDKWSPITTISVMRALSSCASTASFTMRVISGLGTRGQVLGAGF